MPEDTLEESGMEVGISDLNTSQANVYDFSDWTVTREWDGSRNVQV